jgi:hypothetical protein
MRIEALIKLIRNYKKEIEGANQLTIVELVYYDEDSETIRRQIIIDYPIAYKKKEERMERKDFTYHM